MRGPFGSAARRSGALVFLLLSIGCRHVLAPAVSGPPRPGETHIRVLHVVPQFRYVVLECVPVLPEGAVVELFRGGRPVAEVRLTAVRRSGLVAADFVSGEPLSGDLGRILLVHQETVTP